MINIKNLYAKFGSHLASSKNDVIYGQKLSFPMTSHMMTSLTDTKINK